MRRPQKWLRKTNMALGKIKIKIKTPTPTAAERFHAQQQKNRKAAGLPDPSEYKKKLDAMKTEEVEQLDEMPESNMKVRDVHSHLKKAGWELARSKGGHDVFKHPKAKHSIPVPRHALKAPLVRGILKASKVEEQLEKKGRFVSGPIKQPFKSNTIVTAVKEATDPREYDYEGDMAKSDLRSIIHNAQTLHDMLDDDTNLAEWCQSKITLAEDYISTVTNYMRSEMKEEVKDEYARKVDKYLKKKHDKKQPQGADFAAQRRKERLAKNGRMDEEQHSVLYKVKKDDKKIAVAHYKSKDDAHKFLSSVKTKGGNGIVRSKTNEEVEQIDEISSGLKASYVAGAKKQIKQSVPFTKKGEEYRDIAKNFIAKREKGIARANEEVEVMAEDEHDYRRKIEKNNKRFVAATKRQKNPLSNVPVAQEIEKRMKQKSVKESAAEPTEGEMKGKQGYSRKAQIVRDAAKGKKSDSPEKFQKDPELSSEIHKT